LITNTGNCTGDYIFGIAGIQLYFSDYNNLTNNLAFSAKNRALFVFYSDYNILANNTVRANASFGIYTLGAIGNTLINNIVTSGPNPIIIADHSENNTLINNTGECSGPGCQAMWINLASNNNIFINNTANATKGINGVAFLIADGCSNNTIINQIATGGTGIQITNSNNTIFRDCVNVSGADYDIHYTDTGSVNNTFINCSYNTGKESVSSGNELIRKWYYQAKVNNSGGSPVSDANVTAYNTSNLQLRQMQQDLYKDRK
jgi:parallel beta-helix repeat protein